jgi:hypothetical protein
MNRFFLGLRRSQIGRAALAFLAGLTLLIGTAVGQLIYTPPVEATTLAPAPEQMSDKLAEQRAARSQENAERASQAEADAPQSFQEKLNIGEPVPESTKKFFKQVQGEDVQTNESMSPGTRHNTEN